MTEPGKSLDAGGKNLLFLGLGSLLIAVLTTSVSLAVYHYSGDIYLDRSRPGFLPDEKEEKDEQRTSVKYTFPDSGPVDAETLAEYLKEIKPSTTQLDQLPDPFSSDPLSDESLGIPAPEKTEKTEEGQEEQL